MPRRRLVALVAVLVGLLAVPAVASAKEPAAGVQEPTVAWVKAGALDDGRVVVRVRVRHAPLTSPAAGADSIGAVTVVLSRFVGDRDYTIGGSSASRALPVLDSPIGVVYRMILNPRQSAAVTAASTAGTLRGLVLVDQRATARGRTPARAGGFLRVTLRSAALGATEPPAAPPLLENGRTWAAIGADDTGRPFVERVVLGLPGGRRATIVLRTALDVAGGPTAVTGTVRVVDAAGAELGSAPVPAGMTLAVSPTGRERGTLVWPELLVPNVDPIPAGTSLLAPPSVGRPAR